ncbi:MAG: YncE family protein, partial [Thermoplasmata archaeon]
NPSPAPLPYLPEGTGYTSVGSWPSFSTYDAQDGLIYVSNALSNNVSVLNGSTLVATVALLPEPDLNTPGFVVYDSWSGEVDVLGDAVNVGTRGTASILQGTSLVDTVQVGSYPTAAVLDDQNGYVYVANADSNNVTVLNGSTVVGWVAVGSSPSAAIYDPSNGDVYVVNSALYSSTFQSGTVSVLSGLNATATVTVGSTPLWGVYDSVHQLVFVTNTASNTLSILDVGPVPSTGALSTEWYLAIGTGVAIAVGAIALVMVRRPKHPPSSPSPRSDVSPP